MLLRTFLACIALISLFGCSESPPYTNIDNQQLNTLKAQGIPVYDIRRADEWKQTGVIQGSHTLTFVDEKGKLMPDFIEKFTKEVNKNDPVILICRTGNRTDVLSRALIKELGYTKIYNVKNGITRWISEGQPVTRL